MRFQCVAYLCLLLLTNSDLLIVRSVPLEIGISCHLIQIQTVGEDVMSHRGHLRKVVSTNLGATAPAFNSQDAEDLIKSILTFTLDCLKPCQRPYHRAGRDIEMQMMLICTFVFHTKDAEPLIHTSKQQHHKVSNALKYQQEMIRLSNASSEQNWWEMQQQANLSTVAGIL
jgi:hypothetical protein